VIGLKKTAGIDNGINGGFLLLWSKRQEFYTET
jgi:hypothetical protein